MDTIQFNSSRWKTLLLIFAAMGFVAGSIWIFQRAEADLFDKFMSIVGVLFFGAGIPIIFKKFITKEVAVELNRGGLIIKPNSNSPDALAWDQIIGIEVNNISGTKIIAIMVSDPQTWITRESNTIKRNVMKLNNSQYGSPFNLSASGLNVSHKELLRQLEAFYVGRGK